VIMFHLCSTYVPNMFPHVIGAGAVNLKHVIKSETRD